MLPFFRRFMTEEVKKTLGQQIADIQTRYQGQKTQTVRETTEAMAGEYIESLNKVVEDHKHLREPYYIVEILKPDAMLEGVIKLVHVARKTRPLPEWGLALYKVDNITGDCRYEWGLPRAEEAAIMMSVPEGWDPRLIDDISRYLNGTLE